MGVCWWEGDLSTEIRRVTFSELTTSGQSGRLHTNRLVAQGRLAYVSAAALAGAAVQGLGRLGAVTPVGNINSATGVTGTLRPRPAPLARGAGGGGMVATEQRGAIWSALANVSGVSVHDKGIMAVFEVQVLKLQRKK